MDIDLGRFHLPVAKELSDGTSVVVNHIALDCQSGWRIQRQKRHHVRGNHLCSTSRNRWNALSWHPERL